MKRFIFTIMLAIIAMPATAQFYNGGFSPDEYRKAEEAFITKKAHLTPSEAEEFFKLYNESMTKQRALNDKIRDLYGKGWGKDLSDADYIKILDQINAYEVSIAKIKQTYMKKYQKVLSGKKLFMVGNARNRFHRNMLMMFSKRPPQPRK
ncbi:MAG: hypothetical protein IKR18_05200 [Bacteroidaceae bacterium]|nr:hypothetical protein [Bacteroidaceae bacterium]